MKSNTDIQLTTSISETLDELRKVFSLMENSPAIMDLGKLDVLALNFIFLKNELIMSELSNGLGIGISTATTVVDRLVKKGLTSRSRDDEDRRIVKVKLTEEGKKIVLAYREQRQKALEKVMNLLTLEEQENLVSIIRKIAKAMEGGEPL